MPACPKGPDGCPRPGGVGRTEMAPNTVQTSSYTLRETKLNARERNPSLDPCLATDSCWAQQRAPQTGGSPGLLGECSAQSGSLEVAMQRSWLGSLVSLSWKPHLLLGCSPSPQGRSCRLAALAGKGTSQTPPQLIEGGAQPPGSRGLAQTAPC